MCGVSCAVGSDHDSSKKMAVSSVRRLQGISRHDDVIPCRVGKDACAMGQAQCISVLNHLGASCCALEYYMTSQSFARLLGTGPNLAA